MTDFLPESLLGLLPADFTPVQKDIANTLVRHGCVARIGQGPVLGTDTNASDSCRVCMEDLAGELTLRHEGPHIPASENQNSITPADQTSSRACRRTYHLTCLVAWAESNLQQERAITCPGDREILIPDTVREGMFSQHRVYVPHNYEHIRPIESVVPFWSARGAPTTPNIAITINYAAVHPEQALILASLGMDVGFISGAALKALGVADDQYDYFMHYHRYRRVVARSGPDGGRANERIYKTWIYAETGRDIDNTETGDQTIDYMFIPVSEAQGRIFRRYLLGMIGEAYSIALGNNNSFVADRISLSDNEVINLHAETRIRRMLEQDPRANEAGSMWYWPFPNEGGGIVVAGTMRNERRYPARGYALRNLNVGQANDEHFNHLAANPVSRARQQSDALVDPFTQGILPPGFAVDIYDDHSIEDPAMSEINYYEPYPDPPPNILIRADAPQSSPASADNVNNAGGFQNWSPPPQIPNPAARANMWNFRNWFPPPAANNPGFPNPQGQAPPPQRRNRGRGRGRGRLDNRIVRFADPPAQDGAQQIQGDGGNRTAPLVSVTGSNNSLAASRWAPAPGTSQPNQLPHTNPFDRQRPATTTSETQQDVSMGDSSSSSSDHIR